MMKTLTKRWILGFLVGMAPQFLWSLSVTPTYQMFQLKAGNRTVGQLTITNDDDTDLKVTPSVLDFYTIKPNEKFKTTDWLKMDRTPFELKKGESKTINFSVWAPKKAKGELAGTLHFATKSPNVAMVTLQLSLAIYVAVEGTEKADLEIPGMSLKLSSHTEVAVLVNNTGNIHIRPRVLVQVHDEKDDKLLMNAILKYGQPALPGQPRMYQGRVDNYRLPQGKYWASIQIEDVERGLFFPDIKKKFLITADGVVKLR